MLKAVTAVILLAYFFYRSITAVIPLTSIGFAFYRHQEKEKKRLRREELTGQFKECILSTATAMQAGYAVENAFLESRRDMTLLYGEKSMICHELELIRLGLIRNVTLEELLKDLAERSKCEEIWQFAQVFTIAKRSGGNLPEIIRASVELINRRIETAQEIRTLLGGRKMEQNVMRVVPFGIFLYIGISYPGYFDNLYHNAQGIAIMTGCLSLYLAAFVIGEKIMQKIEQTMM